MACTFCGLHQARLARKLPDLALVDGEEVDFPERSLERIELARDPVVHGVAGNELRLPYLFQNVKLDFGIDVRKEHDIRVLIVIDDHRLERGQNIEIGGKGARLVQVVSVFALPVERLSFLLLKTPGIDGLALQELDVLLGEVLADNGDEAYVRKIAG